MGNEFGRDYADLLHSGLLRSGSITLTYTAVMLVGNIVSSVLVSGGGPHPPHLAQVYSTPLTYYMYNTLGIQTQQ